MPSLYPPSLRFEQMAPGENINSWGLRWNVVTGHIDFAIAGLFTKALTADYVLTTANAGDDEARAAILKFTSNGAWTVTIPSVSKTYKVWNLSAFVLTFTTGAGTTSLVQPGEVVELVCDASNVKRVLPTEYGGQKITGVADPTNPQDVCTKAYADLLAFEANAGVFPGQVGNADKLIGTDGTNIFWTGVPAGSGLKRTGVVGSGGSLTFSVDIPGLTVDAAPDPAADYLMTYDASASMLKKVLPNTIPPSMTLLATSTVAGTPPTIVFTGLSQSYVELVVIVKEIAQNSGATPNLQLSLSADNGSNYSSALAIRTWASTANLMIGAIRILGYTRGYGTAIGELADQAAWVSPDLVAISTSQLGGAFKITGGIDALKLSLSAGAFSAGTVEVWGI